MTEAQIVQQINEHITNEVNRVEDKIDESNKELHNRINVVQECATKNETDITWLKKLLAGVGGGGSIGGIVIGLIGRLMKWW